MDKTLVLWTLLLCSLVSVWFYMNIELEIDYNRHPQLIDPQTGAKRKPSELLDLSKVINYTQDYIDSTNAQDRLYDLAYNLNFENPFLIDQSYTSQQDLQLSGWPVANQSKCGQQLRWIADKLDANKNYTFLRGQLGYELTSLMDTFGRPEAGYYSGSTYLLGSHSFCDKLSLDKGNIKTRYCIARMRARGWPKNETIIPKTSIRLGVCLPETCDTSSLNEHNRLIEYLAKLELPELLKDTLELDSMFCLPDERSPIRQIPLAGRIFLAVVGSWLALVLLANVIYETSRARRKRWLKSAQITSGANEDKQQVSLTLKQLESECPRRAQDTSLLTQVMESLSIRCSLKTFKSNTFRVRYNRGDRVRVDLGCLDCAKIVMAIVVVLGHSGYVTSVYSRSLSNRIDMNTGYNGNMILSVARCVDTFFVFFGLLSTYTLLRKFNIRQLSNPITWIGVNVGILLRISPLFMVVYWCSKTVIPYLGSGPWWDYGVDQYSMRGVCMSDSWWKSIPYFASIGRPSVPACILPAWFIVSYVQISLLLPLITYLIYRFSNNFLRFFMTTSLLVISASSIAIRLYSQTSVKEEAFSLYGGFLADLMEKFESTGHMTTLGRLGSVSVGCLVGYLLKMYEDGKIQQWPGWLRSRTTIVVAVIAQIIIVFLPMIGHKIFLVTRRMVSIEEFVGFNALTSILFPVLNAIVILNVTTVNNHVAAVRFFSHTFWHVCNRLSLAIFLVHWEIIFVGITGLEHAPSYGFTTDVMKTWAFAVSASVLLAFVIHIIIECPFSKLTAILAGVFMSPAGGRGNHSGSERSMDLETKKNRLEYV